MYKRQLGRRGDAWPAAEGLLSVPRLGHGAQHRHQSAVGIFAVAEGVIKGDAELAAIDIQQHPLGFHLQHAGLAWVLSTAVMARVGHYGFGVVVIHVRADAIADGGGECGEEAS